MMREKQFFVGKKTLAMILFLFVIIIFPSCEREYFSSFPQALTGIWVTNDLRYNDRYIEFSEDHIIFGLGEDKIQILTVNRIEKTINGPIVELTFFCQDLSRDPLELIIFFKDKTDNFSISGSVWLKNKEKIIWHKATGDS